jgi:ubiquitin-protein ligase
MQEVQQLRQQPPEGIRLEFNEEDLTDLSCFLIGPGNTEI